MKAITWLRIIFIQALLAMSGSLYFSNFGDPLANIAHGNFFGGIGFEPCHLCRWARILMYPLVIISFIGLVRKDTKIAYTILPISAIGIILTSYHYIIQQINSLNVLSCAPGNPCTLIDWKMW
ncbi:MAG: disulfide bond formation protein B [bacterium]